ncbi:methionyl-tRNA formyltransferase [Caldimonas thermodepolymerans]|uniref:Methionyl-tRNA formyltransferase n=1 Tax=Caldimonas thermodepolymerans TaxID=215580 RepID=A0A2S5T0P2_9BURK|nr:methionyl-tRNA formyltransferase [Caldimonas thermodepolymerans]PPE68591.1 methionyl-tRNA formyltransferase [Caldimonas thermodepolymerans]QPC32008.1 methionyl-tRNA formyltransferase [Caldimonas thermodepolymerans]RDI01466.1 methionyl-tRNA formyltransferase [Caldimonas thermodepolymerans]
MKVAFAGTPEFAQVALEQLHAAGFAIPLVLTQPDRPAGRGMKLQASPVKQFAVAHGIPVAQPRSLRLDGKYPDDARAAQAALQAAAPDVMVVAAYGLILPGWVLTLPRLGCLNIHASLLPRWRGAAPIHRAIEAGDAETGITIMQMDAGLDTGDMLLVERVPIAPGDTTASLHDRLAALGGRLVVEALELAACGGLRPVPQPAEGVTYAHKIDKAEAEADWTLPAAVIERRIRAFDPFPGVVTHLGDVPLKCWAAELTDGTGAPGTVLAVDERGPVVACGEGALRLTQLQKPGGKRLPAREFLRGHAVEPGMVLERRVA